MSERRFNPEKMAKLDSPERRKLLPREEILALLNINKDDVVLDLGAGTGYFTFPASKKTNANVFALDIESKMLEFMKEQINKQSIPNIDLIQGPIENIPLDDTKVDRVIASMVLHEVEPLSKGLEEIYRVLKPGGRCICVEWEKKVTDQGPPLHHRVYSKDMEDAMKQTGFQDISISYLSESVYVIAFSKQ